jgi:hypothetical protein
MKIDFAHEFKTIDGDVLLRAKRNRATNATDEVPATLQWAVVEALLATQQNETLSGEDKAKRYDLALKIQEAKAPVELPVEDVAFLKKLCDTHFTPLIVGQTRRLFDSKSA